MLSRRCLFELALLALTGCSGERTDALAKPEWERIAWLVEDLAHARQRDPRVLLTGHATQLGTSIYDWLHQRTASAETVLPGPLRRRQQRWPRIGRALRAGLLRSHADGRLRLDREQTPASMLSRLVAEENRDRSLQDSLLLERCGLQARDPAAGHLLSLLLTARRHLDRTAEL